MDPYILLLGMIAISTLLFVLSHSLCRDPDRFQTDVERQRQRALAEVVVRNMDTQELIALASGRVPAGVLLANARGSARGVDGVEGEESQGVTDATRASFIKISARGKFSPRTGPNKELAKSLLGGATPEGEEKVPPPPGGADVILTPSAVASANAKQALVTETASAELQHIAVEGGVPETSNPSNIKALRVDVDELTLTSSTALGAVASKQPHVVLQGLSPTRTSEDAQAGGIYSDNSCSVCLDEYQDGDELLQLTCCHVFHRACIDLWLKSHCVCPCCRTDLNQLAQVAQIFPDVSRRILQRELIRANGDALSAIEYLLNRRRETQQILAHSTVGHAALDCSVAPGSTQHLLGHGGSRRGRGAGRKHSHGRLIGGGSRGRRCVDSSSVSDRAFTGNLPNQANLNQSDSIMRSSSWTRGQLSSDQDAAMTDAGITSVENPMFAFSRTRSNGRRTVCGAVVGRRDPVFAAAAASRARNSVSDSPSEIRASNAQEMTVDELEAGTPSVRLAANDIRTAAGASVAADVAAVIAVSQTERHNRSTRAASLPSDALRVQQQLSIEHIRESASVPTSPQRSKTFNLEARSRHDLGDGDGRILLRPVLDTTDIVIELPPRSRP